MTSNIESVISVATLNRLARGAIEAALPLAWVAGEISNLTHAASGHLYFTLKDDAAQVRCVMFRGRAQLLAFRPANGARVEVRGLASLYEPRGDFQLGVESIRHAGLGALFEAFQRLRERLAAEGLFDAGRKRALPSYPTGVAVITSAQAAALRDIVTTLARRAPHLAVRILPVPVQGADAAAAMIGALGEAGRSGCEVVILARGGGSLEDLWAFNDEQLARAIARCPLPVVTGIGHETDTTLADFVADQRAATPTAAAELVSAGFVAVVPHLARLAERLRREARRSLQLHTQQADLVAGRLVHPGERLARAGLQLAHLGERLGRAMAEAQRRHHRELDALRRRVLAPRPLLAARRDRLLRLSQQAAGAWRNAVERRRHRLAEMAVHLGHLDPAAALRRGYAIVRDPQGDILRSGAGLHPGDPLDIEFAADRLRARVAGPSG